MSEKPLQQEAYFPPEDAEVYQALSMVTSPTHLELKRQQIETELESDEALLEFHRLTLDHEEALAKADHTRKSIDRVKQLGSEVSNFDIDTRNRYRNLNLQLSWLRDGTLPASSEDFEANKFLKYINSAPYVQPIKSEEAPFANYASNSDAWQVVSNEQIESYLEDRLFMKVRPGITGLNKLLIESENGQPMELPLDLFVYAAGFDSWNGREGPGDIKKPGGDYSEFYEEAGLSSQDLIKHYASLPSDIPAISKAVVYVQPDGTMFADNSNGDSHRIAAAILRGQESIGAHNITLVPIEENIIS